MNNITATYFRDEYLSDIYSYESVPFEDDHGNGGFAFRIIEVYRLFKMRGDIEELEEIIGERLFTIYPEVAELKILLARGKLICKEAKLYRDNRLNELEEIRTRFEQARKGGGYRPKQYVDAREWLADLELQVLRGQSSLEEAEYCLKCRRGLLGLLRPAVMHMLNVMKVTLPVGILNDIPEDDLPGITYSAGSSEGRGLKSHQYAWQELNKLENAVKHIVISCTPSNDRYEMNNRGGKWKYKHYRYYYSKQAGQLRKLLTAREYVENMRVMSMTKEIKTSYLKSPL